MSRLAVIGGSGLVSIPGLNIKESKQVDTPYGDASASLVIGNIHGVEIVFLPRHGADHNIPPHKINYRANIWALKSIGVSHVIGVAAVGGISQNIPPETIVIANQLIDYSYERKQTFFEDELTSVTHIDFTHPYCEELRTLLLNAAENIQLDVVSGGTYGVTQGPRLETAAEVRRLEKDGCNFVGMTGMPEAGLAKELELCYANCSLSVNWAAGKSEDLISIEEIKQSLEKGIIPVQKLIIAVAKLFVAQ